MGRPKKMEIVAKAWKSSKQIGSGRPVGRKLTDENLRLLP